MGQQTPDKKATKKIVINRSIGGFKLSVKAVHWLYNKGFDGAYFKWEARLTDELVQEDLEEWRKWLVNQEQDSSDPLTIFSPDEKYIFSPFLQDEDRCHPLVIECVELLGTEASDRSELKVVEIPADVDYYIHEDDDGTEVIAEKHRTWR